MIPAARVRIVSDDGAGRVEAHVERSRSGVGVEIVDFYSNGDRACTCYAITTLLKPTCQHIAVVADVVARAVHP